MTAHISIVVHPERDRARQAAKRIIDSARVHGIEVSAGTDDATESLGLTRSDQKPDVVVTVGGDGTIMRAAATAVPEQIPILGFNLGAVGFLAEAEPERIEEVMTLLADGDFTVEEHMTLEVLVPGMEPRIAINDVVFAKQERQRLVSVTLSVNGELFHTYRADALVIATPTGSTAYSLSAGGPVVDPDIEAMVVTPVAPHALFGRPVVFAGSTVLGCSAGSPRTVGIDIDGMPIGDVEDEVIVRRSKLPAKFVQIDGPTFPSNLVTKLGLREVLAVLKLEELIVTNLGLIAEAHLEPGDGLVVITGETGTGKTMLLGAVELLLGRTAASNLVGPVGEEAAVQGRFRGDDDSEIVASRRVVGGGRSRAYLDAEMVPARTLTEQFEPVMEVVKQGDARRLADPAAFRRLVDGCLDSDGRTCVRTYQDAWAELGRLKKDQATLGGDTRALERELDLARYQSEEIAAAGFEIGDDTELAQRIDRLRHAGDLSDALDEAASHLSEQDNLASAVAAMRRAASFDSTLTNISDQLDALQSEWAESLNAIRDSASTIEHNPAALEEIDSRLTVLGELKRKYGSDLEAVISFGSQASTRAAEVEALLQRAGDLDRELEAATEQVAQAGEALRTARVRAGKVLATEAIHHLKDLGFSRPAVEVEVVAAEPGPTGADQTRLLFASEDSLALAPAHKSASGGELSRLILAVRLATGAGDASMIVFDEVDAGVGGATALAMGEKLAGLSDVSQVFCVTHLPQVAAFADRHYVVEREGNLASVRPVFDEDRTAELTRMMAGLGESTKGRQHAVELLETAKARRRR